MEETYVGIDIHRDYGVACVRDLKGEIVDEFEFGNNIEGIHKVREKLGKKQCACGNRVNRQHVGCIVGHS